MSNQVSSYDFRYNAEDYTREDIEETLREFAKQWVFQLEEGDSGYRHYQGRLSLKKKRRLSELKPLWLKHYWDGNVKAGLPNYIAPTANAARGGSEEFYVTKLDTRIDGPWSDTDEEVYVPRDVRGLNLLDTFPNAWQQKVLDMYDQFEIRKVDVIIDFQGGKGKSSIVRYMGVHGKAKKIPFANDFKDVMRMVMDMPTQKMYFIDMPRAIGKERLYQLYGAIEEIKSGYAYDDRYHFKDKYFDPPRVVVITNTPPDLRLLSADRWNLWTIENDDLVPWTNRPDTEYSLSGQEGDES